MHTPVSAEILNRLRVCPRSTCELSEEMKVSCIKVDRAIRELLETKEIEQMNTERQEGPFWAIPGIEYDFLIDWTEVIALTRDYAQQTYENMEESDDSFYGGLRTW